MPRITIEISASSALEIQSLVDSMNQQDNLERGTSHGEMTMKKLITLLAEDAALVESRPGSWEGANMAAVLQSHGYRV